MRDFEQVIRDYIAQEFLHDKPLHVLEGNLVEEGIVDSLAILTLIAYVEKEFGAKIKPADVVVENFESVGAIARLVRQRLKT